MKKLNLSCLACLILILLFRMQPVTAQVAKPLKDSTAKDTIKNGKSLEEVTIITHKKMIERKLDRTIVNVAGFITAAGTDALELLGRLPGLRVTDDGNVKLLGKGASIYIDGKSTYLSGSDLASYLRSLPTDLLDKIELMPNPPAKYDAAGSGGVINMITKKNKQAGYNVGMSLNGGTGVYRKANAALNMGYRIGKLNLFANGGAGSPKDFENATANRRFYNSDGTTAAILQQESDIASTRNSGNLKLGLDYYLTNRTTFGIIFNGNSSSVKEIGANQNLMWSSAKQLDSTIYSKNDAKNKFKNNLVNFNVVHQFDSTGKALSFDLDYGNYHTQISQIFGNQTFSYAAQLMNNERIRGDLPREISIYSAKTDLTLPFKNGARFNAGIKVSTVSTDNEATYFIGPIDREQIDYTRTNRFLFKETIEAGYVEGYKELGKFALQLGLRAEKTHSEGHQLGNKIQPDSSFLRNYLNIFPSVFISFKPDSSNSNQYNFSYSRRIGRPGYDLLNPFLSLIQRYNQVIGNPFLKPDFTHNFELTHNYKDHLNTVLYYSRVSDITSHVISSLGDIYIRRPENTGNLRIAGMMVTYNRDLFKRWNTDVSVNPERIHLNVLLDGKRVDTIFYSNSLNWFNRITLGKKTNAELVLNWGGRSFSGQSTTKGIVALRAGIKHQLFSGNGTIALSGNDLFYSAITNGKILNVNGSQASYRNRKDSRTIMVSFSYRFSKNAKDNKSLRDRNGLDDEKRRVSTSDGSR